MKKLRIECKECKYIMTLEGEDPDMAFQYLTDSNKTCKHCHKPLVFSRSDNNDFKAHKSSPKVCPECFGTGERSYYPKRDYELEKCRRCKGTGKAS